ncbi:hypothetical protein [Oceanobacillus kimchii]|uniref:Uncharacterized protein n=1 Tax=Oceanobacillus kimchii TaxID=746691 RepID=A0ABQ5TJG6_9BACI|nr:hypothetical protein [Oceanobacillus kimchii]GLO66247.1 hypothetical protein MACH08_20310 [Oceanobacillus kimchii]
MQLFEDNAIDTLNTLQSELNKLSYKTKSIADKLESLPEQTDANEMIEEIYVAVNQLYRISEEIGSI